jgi:hypothetical protein
MKKRVLRGVMVAALLLGGLAFSAALTAPAQAKVAPASTSTHGGGHQTVQPLGGCIGPFCGRVYNDDDAGQVYIADNWCGGGPCGNFAVMNPGDSSTNHFNDTDGFAPGPNTCNLWVQINGVGSQFTATISSWTKISDDQTVYVLDAWC